MVVDLEMATTINTDGSKVEAMPYAEDDKLGPLGSRRSVIDDEIELRQALVAEFQAAADAVRDAASSVDRSATTAVHEYRKALRRARAVLSLVADALPKSERRAVLRALRDARRALGTARDHAVAPDTIDLLSLGEVERGTAKAIIDTAAEAVPPIAEIKQLLAEGAARTAAQVEALEAALPAAISFDTVLNGVREVYAEARRARKGAKRSKAKFHSWRRRTKELVYQLDVIGGYAGQHVAELQREIEAVTETQGPAVDLIMLRDFARTHSAGVAPEALDPLLETIGVQIQDLMTDSRRAGRDAFRRKPRRFTRKLEKAARRDLAPVELPDDVD